MAIHKRVTHGHLRGAVPSPLGLLSAALIAFLCIPAVASAQTLRADEIADQQAAKVLDLRPYEPTRVERVLTMVTDNMFAAPIGLYPFVGSIYPGGGFAAGPAVRLPYSDTHDLVAETAWSVRRYKLARASVRIPAPARDQLRVIANAQVIDAPRVAFYGVGPDSARRARTTFLYRPVQAGVTASAGTRGLSAGGGLTVLSIRTGPGAGRGVPIQEQFTPAMAPGVGVNPPYTVARLFAEFDWRESPGYTTRGGLYRVDWATYRARDGLPYSFERIDLDLTQHVPLVRANWVLAFRAAASLTSAESDHDVPFFLMPSLGSGTALRGFDNFRFRDRQSLLFTGEYRWRPSRFLDMAVFYETGRVAPRLDAMRLRDFERSYGIGARFHAPAATVLRFELARSHEGMRFIAGAGPVF
jgi:hypothetical protein